MFRVSTNRRLRGEVAALREQVNAQDEDITRLVTHVRAYRQSLDEVLYLAGAKPTGAQRADRPDLTVIRGDGAR